MERRAHGADRSGRLDRRRCDRADVLDLGKVRITTNILEACREASVEKLVHTSTSEVYGTALYVPIDEKHPLQPQSPYSASKIGADQLALSYHLTFDLPVSVIRPFNTYGPRQSSRAVIPTIIVQALRGEVVRLGATSPTRDLVFVADTVEGFCRIAACDGAVGEVINIGTSREIAIGDLAGLIFEMLGRQPEILSEEARNRPENSEVQRLLADSGKAEQILGWKPGICRPFSV